MNAPVPFIKQWLTAREIAALGLPGCPTTESGAVRWAKRENWPSRERVGRGGGREYPLEALPAKARTAYVARHLATIEVPVPMQAEASREPEAMSLTDRAAEARDARLALLGLVERFIAGSSAPKRIADQHFCDLYNAGSMDIASWIREQVKTLTPRTLFRWRQTRRAGRTARLGVDRAAARKGKGVLDTANGGEIKNFVLALLARQPHLTADHIRDIVSGRFEKGLELVSKDGEIRFVPVPPLRTFQHALRGWKVDYKVELTAISDPDGFKSKYRLTGRNSYAHVRHANQLWMIDASPADVLCLDGRHTIYVAIEVFTRRIIIYVTKTPRASAVGLLMRRAILAWGVPQLVKTDK